ncbi:hypothetical protein M0811_07398 [Anaeramoeba ignava]|uniref:Uncharacterized protein n=1 Tax=Anaeramoeba ignava TaxID=1746090 RepID=A0A9Q0LQ24_ANAIG|nr:hypothetical protein M0811_07398 [Anaeramoeba ignava]
MPPRTFLKSTNFSGSIVPKYHYNIFIEDFAGNPLESVFESMQKKCLIAKCYLVIPSTMSLESSPFDLLHLRSFCPSLSMEASPDKFLKEHGFSYFLSNICLNLYQVQIFPKEK